MSIPISVPGGTSLKKNLKIFLINKKFVESKKLHIKI